MNIVVFGAGYVGLVTATGLAELGNHVLCVEVDLARVEALRAGKIPIFEPGLAELVTRNTREGRIDFTAVVPDLSWGADTFVIAVGTPPRADGSADVSAVLAVAETIAARAARRALVIVKSTVPVGTGDRVQHILDTHLQAQTPARSRLGLEHVSNPEFLREGSAIDDFFSPERIVCGVRSTWAEERMRALYAPLQLEAAQVQIIDVRSAELCKYAANALLALRISFMNEMARLCDALGADVHDVRCALGGDSRIGHLYLNPGPGYGGSCFPKDVQALACLGRDVGVRLLTVEATHETNDAQRRWVLEKTLRALGDIDRDDPQTKRVAIWGLAFKPETDDVRECAALAIVPRLLDLGIEVRVHDPEATDNFLRALGPRAAEVKRCGRAIDAIEDADVLLLLTEWHSYRSPDFPEVAARMRSRVIVDARNVWGAAPLAALGFKYHSLGLGPREARETREAREEKTTAVTRTMTPDRELPIEAE